MAEEIPLPVQPEVMKNNKVLVIQKQAVTGYTLPVQLQQVMLVHGIVANTSGASNAIAITSTDAYGNTVNISPKGGALLQNTSYDFFNIFFDVGAIITITSAAEVDIYLLFVPYFLQQ